MRRLPWRNSQRFRSLDKRFVAYSIRERSLLTVVLAGFTFLFIDQVLVRPVSNERSRITLGIETARTEIESSRSEIERLERMGISDEERKISDRAERLRQQIREIEKRMQATVDSLVPPNAIVSVLEDLLASSEDLHLVRLESHPPQPITSGNSEGTDESEEVRIAEAETANLYRHGLTLEIEGQYEATTTYLKRIEASPWHLLWERFEYTVEEHPTARITIDLHTISDKEEWIGV